MNDDDFYSEAYFAQTVKFVDESLKVVEKRSKEEKFATSLAIVLNEINNVTAIRIILNSDSCEIIVASNNKWSQEQEDYYENLSSLIQDLSIQSSRDIPKEDVARLMSEIRELIYEHCKSEYNNRVIRLLRDWDKSNVKDLISRFVEQTGLNKDYIVKEDMTQVTYRCLKFCNDNRVDPMSIDKVFTHISKIGSYALAINVILTCAISEKYRYAMKNFKLRRLDPIRLSVKVKTWSTMASKYIKDEKKIQEFKSICINNPRRSRPYDVYGRNWETKSKTCTLSPKMHAEMIIVQDILMSNDCRETYIGVSKRCCFLCYKFIECLNSKGWRIRVRSMHGKLYASWLIPTINDRALEDSIIKSMISTLRNRTIDTLSKARFFISNDDDDTMSENSDDIDIHNFITKYSLSPRSS